MAKLSVSETTTFRWSFEEDVARYAAARIPAIGVWRHKLSDCGLPAALALLRRAGLKVSHLSWAGGFTSSVVNADVDGINKQILEENRRTNELVNSIEDLLNELFKLQ